MGYSNSNEFFYTRLTSLFLVSLFAVRMGFVRIQNWLNKTPVGKTLLQKMWQRINNKAHVDADYDRPDGRVNGFHNLKPDTELFWENDSTGVNQRKDFFDTISKKTTILRQDIESLNDSGVVLADEARAMVPADIIICATGWKTDHPYFDEHTAASLGLPVSAHSASTDSEMHWNNLARTAERSIIDRFPVLDGEWAKQQVVHKHVENNTRLPFRLWRSIVPPSEPSILFVGKVMLGNHFRASEVQALFACAVLDNGIILPTVGEMEADISETLAWCRKRYLAKGLSGNWFYWDMVPYTDSLLADLGLSSHRSWCWMRDLLRPCYAEDLKGLLEEYYRKRGECSQ